MINEPDWFEDMVLLSTLQEQRMEVSVLFMITSHLKDHTLETQIMPNCLSFPLSETQVAAHLKLNLNQTELLFFPGKPGHNLSITVTWA